MDQAHATLRVRGEQGCAQSCVLLHKGAYEQAMKADKPTLNPDDIELYPDAMERLERAVKAMARRGPISTDVIKKAARKPAKKATRRP